MEEIADIPKGYKQTEVGVIPEDWEVKALGELVNYTKGYAFHSADYQSLNRFLRVSDTGVKFITA